MATSPCFKYVVLSDPPPCYQRLFRFLVGAIGFD